MEIKFENNLPFQIDAINSITNIFESQKFIQNTDILIPENGVISNRLELTPAEILVNIKKIQENNGIPLTEKLAGMNFTVEMETGTGKTYVYLRTIFELNKDYGFKKFIIVVPSVAIKEGALKSLRITKNHFKEIYGNIPYSFYEYSSGKTITIKNFSRSNKIEIMVITIDSFNKDHNIMNTPNPDHFSGEKPIEFIQKTQPILILDEPQNMETVTAKNAISNLNPLFTLRYSATHKNNYNLVYRLTPIDAFKENLVKKIEVMSVIKDGDFNNAYIKCVEIKAEKQGIKCKLALNKKLSNSYKVVEFIIKNGQNLSEKTNNSEYEGFIVTEINAKYNYVKFLNGIKILLNEQHGGSRKELMQIQIQKTVQEHFQKYEILKSYGIKPLSLFFIDKVDNYLLKDGFIRIEFEKSFERYKKGYKDFEKIKARDVHSGYFSERKTDNAIQRDKTAFDLIMRAKERLLSFEEPVQFIFSHSALREGWDNPNVFNICTLNQTQSTMKKRQEIGRGMRLPVNQNGERVHIEHNILTVIANESYQDYASKLQTEYRDEFGASPEINNHPDKIELKLKKKVLLEPEFKEIWDKISKKTRYAVKIKSQKLIDSCVSDIESNLKIDSIKVNISTASLELSEEKLEDNSVYNVNTDLQNIANEQIKTNFTIPNIVEQLSNETKLTRSTIVKILTKINNLHLIFKNPQSFMLEVSSKINKRLREFLLDGLEYVEINEWYKMECFDKIIPTYKTRIIDVENSIYDKIACDSDPEVDFTKILNNNKTKIRLFFKLPVWFKVPTPIGNYNPDWAIVREDKDEFGKLKQILYFVAETKTTLDSDELRPREERKFECARKHFDVINVKYDVVIKPEDLLTIFSQEL